MADSTTVKEKNGQYQHFVDYCTDKFDKISDSDYRQGKINNNKEAHRIYRQIEKTENKFWPNESKVVLPLLTITVDNIEPRLVAGLVGKLPYVQLEMDGITEQDQNTKILEDFINQELKHTVKLEYHAGTIIHKALLEGTVYPICSYDEDDVMRRDFVFEQIPKIDPQSGMPAIDPQTGQPVMDERIAIDPKTRKYQTQDVKDSIFKGGKIEYADFSDVYVADDVDEWEKADVFRVVRRTYGDLYMSKDKPGYMNIDSWLLSEAVEDDEHESEDNNPSSFAVENAKRMANKVVELIECSVSYVLQTEDQDEEDVTDWTSRRYVALITRDSRILVRLIPLLELNYKNEHLIKRIRMYPDEGKAYGTSLFEKLKAIQNGTTDMFNLSANIAMLVLMPWFFYTDSSGMPGTVKLELGAGVKVDDPSQIKFPEFRQNPRSFMPFIEMFLGMWQKEGAIGDIQTGQIAAKNRDVTAAETMASIQEGNIKHNYQTIAVKDDFLAVVKTLYDLYYQKMPAEAQFIFQGQPTTIPRSAMRRNHTFKLTGSTDLANKIIDMQKSQSMYQMLRPDPMTNPMQLIADVVTSHKPDAQPERYINPQVNQIFAILQQFPELMEMIMQYPQQMQQQQVQAEQQIQQQEMQLRQASAQQEMQIKEQKAMQDAQLRQAKFEQDRQLKVAKAVQDAALKQQQKNRLNQEA